MQTKSSSLPDFMPVLIFVPIVLWVIFLTLALTHKANADEMTFQSPIDYWGTEKPSVKESANTGAVVNSSKQKPTDSNFDWKKYLNPQNKEFFKEGDYTPPEPFMEIVRNPTDENLKLWFSYIDMKNKLFQKLESRIAEFKGDKIQLTSDEKTQIVEKLKANSAIDPDVKRFRFRLYFDSQCPHCKRMFSTVSDLQQKGYLVEARQLDKNPLGSDLPFPVEQASKKEVDDKNITSVPLLLVGDLKAKSVYKITGFQTTTQVLGYLKNIGP